jgi:hypothetical protein
VVPRVLDALDRRFGGALRAAGAGSAISTLLLAALLVACGDGSGGGTGSSDRGAGVGALGGSAETETLARTRIAEVQPGELVWTAHEIRLAPGQAIEHQHEPAFVYGRGGEPSLPVKAGLATATRQVTMARSSGRSASRGREPRRCPARRGRGASSRARRSREFPRPPRPA